MKSAVSAVCAVCAVCAFNTSAAAQHAPRALEARQDTVRGEQRVWSAVRVVKWGALAASTGSVVYGFTQNRSADREYEAIERLCDDSPALCATKPDSDEYADPALESRYQSVLKRDDRAKVALLAGQVGLAASVLLFILDLPKGSTPADIPYDPRSLRLGLRADQLQLGLHFSVR